MQRDIAAGDFIEHAEFSGNLYGTRWAEFGVDQGNPRIGRRKLSHLSPLSYDVLPVSHLGLADRLQGAGGPSHAQARLSQAILCGWSHMRYLTQEGVGSDRQLRPDQKPKLFWLLAAGQVQRTVLSENLSRPRVCLNVLGSTDGAGFSEPLLFPC